MKLLPYPKYKKTGIAWLPYVPSHWTVSKVKFKIPFQVGWTPPTGVEANFVGANLWANISDLKSKFIEETKTHISDDAAAKASMEITPKGSLLYSFKLSVGTVAFAGRDLYTNEAIASFLPSENINISFLYYAAPEFIEKNASKNIYGASILNQELIRNATLIAPQFSEQTQIAAFLDRETAKIDLLIEKQQRLIELLEEKRQAVISHAVTKGLNPNVPMKESGVEWLGEVPTHWQLKKLKHIKSPNPNSFVDGPFGSNLKSEHFIDNGDVYVIESNFATQNKLSPQKLKTISLEHFNTISRSSCQGGDIIIAKIGAQYGKSSILPVLDKPAVVSGNSLKLTVNASLINVEYLKHVLQHLKQEGAMDDIVNSTAQPALTLGGMNNISIPLPKLDEQEAIIHYINTESKRLNRAINSSKKLIELSRERRTSLISAAVTGKIDVRDQVPQDVEEAVAS